ncbi:MAG: hypothetical protein WCT24_03890 [Patescibacteria group bacterium]|jgi:hypothetical protein
MWDIVPKKQQSFVSALDWVGALEKDERILGQAEIALEEGLAFGPEISKLYATPQSPPWHAEGRDIREHLKRMFCGLFGVLEGKTLLHIEEFQREKHVHAEVRELQETIQEGAGTLKAFIYLHDIAKAETLSFHAPLGSLGSKEGFAQRDRHHPILATERERALFQKLWNAFAVRHPGLSPRETQTKFYDTYEIEAHYFRHAIVGASDTYLALRQRVCEALRLNDRDARMLHFLIRYHMDPVDSVESFRYMADRATKDGLDADDALDLLLATRFLDSGVGSLWYKENEQRVDLNPTLTFLRAEELSHPVRRETRRKKEGDKVRALRRTILREAKLDGDSLFELLKTPFGPERKIVMEEIESRIEEHGKTIDFGLHESEIARRIAEAKKTLTAREVA